MMVFADNLIANAAALEDTVSPEAVAEPGFDLILEDVSETSDPSGTLEVSESPEVSDRSEVSASREKEQEAPVSQEENIPDEIGSIVLPEVMENTEPAESVNTAKIIGTVETIETQETATDSESAKVADVADVPVVAEDPEVKVDTKPGTDGENAETAKRAETAKAVEPQGTSESRRTSEGEPVSVPMAAVMTPATELNLREDAIVRAIRSARPAVVNIRGEKVMKSVPYDAAPANTPSGASSDSSQSLDSQHVNGMGTGIIFDSRGYIVTNFHVVDGIREIHVTTADAKTYVAQVLARDRETDLAVIKIDALAGEVFDTIHLGESSDLMTGETVIAVGNAFGYEHTVTKGIISALHRSVQVSDVQFYQDLVQTDASINPGNSGGPLLNINGEMIGINVAVRAGAQGIGFAIPVNRAMEVVSRMVESFSAETNWHGIQFVSLPIGSARGAVVQSVEPNSPAESIGLRPGDVILAVNQEKVAHELDFACAILELKAGETIRLSVSRNEKKASVRLTMGAVSVQHRTASAYTPDGGEERPAFDAAKLTTEEVIWKQVGVLVTPVTGNTIPLQGGRTYRGGLLVQNVRPESPAARQGIRAGDVLLGILRWETLSLDNMIFVLEQPELQNQNQIKFLIARNGKVHLGYFVSRDFVPASEMETASAAYQTRK